MIEFTPVNLIQQAGSNYDLAVILTGWANDISWHGQADYKQRNTKRLT